MTETPLDSRQTPEELLESEIEELEKRTLNSGWLWGAAALALVLLAAAAFLITFWDNRQAQAHRSPATPEAMILTEPKGKVDRNLTFRWDRVNGAGSYVVLCSAAEGGEVEVLRSVKDLFLRPTDVEASNLNPGSYTWSVEARSEKDELIGFGKGAFTIPPGQ